MANKETILKVITMLEAAYDKEVSDDTAAVYVELLGDIPDNHLMGAAKQLLSDSKWFPKISELRNAAASLANPQIPSASEAWEEVQREIVRVGYAGKPEFENPLAAKMVKSFGWKYLCHSENMMADRAHFLKAYEQVATREKQERVMLPEIREMAKQLAAGNE